MAFAWIQDTWASLRGGIGFNGHAIIRGITVGLGTLALGDSCFMFIFSNMLQTTWVSNGYQ
jgi:hypothetical protein